MVGAVACKEKCGPFVTVTLTGLSGMQKQETKKFTLTDESGQFLFSNAVPGKYRLEVKH